MTDSSHLFSMLALSPFVKNIHIARHSHKISLKANISTGKAEMSGIGRANNLPSLGKVNITVPPELSMTSDDE